MVRIVNEPPDCRLPLGLRGLEQLLLNLLGDLGDDLSCFVRRRVHSVVGQEADYIVAPYGGIGRNTSPLMDRPDYEAVERVSVEEEAASSLEDCQYTAERYERRDRITLVCPNTRPNAVRRHHWRSRKSSILRRTEQVGHLQIVAVRDVIQKYPVLEYRDNARRIRRIVLARIRCQYANTDSSVCCVIIVRRSRIEEEVGRLECCWPEWRYQRNCRCRYPVVNRRRSYCVSVQIGIFDVASCVTRQYARRIPQVILSLSSLVCQCDTDSGRRATLPEPLVYERQLILPCSGKP